MSNVSTNEGNTGGIRIWMRRRRRFHPGLHLVFGHCEPLMLRRLYLSPLGWIISAVMRGLAALRRPFMVYGYRDVPSRTWRKFTRISSSVAIGDRAKISMGDHVWISHYCMIDGSEGVVIGKGCQISSSVGIFTHGSHRAVRLYGEKYIRVPADRRKGYSRGTVVIGEFSFIGANSIILPGVSIGKGALIGAGSVVTKDIPDFSIARGAPAKVVGDTRVMDETFWNDPEIQASYFDRPSIEAWLQAGAALKVRT